MSNENFTKPPTDSRFENFNKAQLLKILGIKGTAFEDRVSDLFLQQLHYGIVTDAIHPHRVMDEILHLEGLRGSGRASLTPAPDQFRGGALRGLWKKYYSQSNFIPKILGNSFKLDNPESKKFEELCMRLQKQAKNEQEFAYLVAHAFVVEEYERLSTKGKLTGEWIVFAKHEGLNYYLTIAFHKPKETTEQIYDRIVRHCFPQFPFLKEGFGALISQDSKIIPKSLNHQPPQHL